MKKHTNQTCLRLPDVLKDEMSNICDKYQINHSDLMRRAISEFVQTHTENPENNGKLMFVWFVRYHLGESVFSYNAEIPRTLRPIRPLRLSAVGSFFVSTEKMKKKVSQRCSKFAVYRVSEMRWQSFITNSTHDSPTHTISVRLSRWEDWPPLFAWRLPCFLEVLVRIRFR